ncbi:unnamed protein product [[Candida] boidinii]|nr:unnamed protein product [[Candida] boidinii]
MSEENDPLLAALNADEPSQQQQPSDPVDEERERALTQLKNRLIEHSQWESRLKELRLGIRDLEKNFDKTEADIKALQSIGQVIGEVLKQLDEERFIVKASSGPRYIVGCRKKLIH